MGPKTDLKKWSNRYTRAPSNGWCLKFKGLLKWHPFHQFGTPWRVQGLLGLVQLYIIMKNLVIRHLLFLVFQLFELPGDLER